MRYLITPFDSVEQWIKNNNVSFDKRLDHIEEIDIAPGDHIIGQLDIQQMKMLNRKRANYEHLLVDWPKDISAEQVTPELIESLNAKISKTYISIAGEGRLSTLKRRTKTSWLACIRWFEQQERKPIAIWFYTNASLLCFAWFDDMLSGSDLFKWIPFLNSQNPNPQQVNIYPTLISFAFYAFFSTQLIRIGKKLLPPIRKIRVTDNKKSKKVLIHTLSVYNNQPKKIASGAWQITLRKFNHPDEHNFTFSKDLLFDTAELTKLETRGFSWNGTQLLRALSAHVERIELLVLIGTKPNARQKGSAQHAPLIKAFLAQYLDSRVCAIHIEPECLDAINVNAAYSSLNQILERIIRETCYASKNLCVDITGATAAISCACSMATLHTNAQFQYVTTDGEGKVYQQDLMYMTSPAKVTP